MAGYVNQADKDVLDFMRENNLHTEFVRFSAEPTGHAMIQVDAGGQNCITVFSGSNYSFTENHILESLSQFSPGDIVLLQNESNHLGFIIEQAHRMHMKVAFNPSPFEAEILRLPLDQVDYFLLNEIEGEQISGSHDQTKMLSQLSEKYPSAVHVLTLGKQGVVCKSGDAVHRHGIYNVPVVDTTAAGDTFTGYFLSGVAHGKEIPEALMLASKASSIAVPRKGATASIPCEAEVLAFSAALL